MTLHEMSISAIQQALSAGELSAARLPARRWRRLRALTRRSAPGPP
jgi:hypothetical protein